jgi:hypothetical protein
MKPDVLIVRGGNTPSKTEHSLLPKSIIHVSVLLKAIIEQGKSFVRRRAGCAQRRT